MTVIEQRLFHQVDLPHPGEDAGVLLLQKFNAGKDRLGPGQVREGHGQRDVDAIGRLTDVIGGIVKIVRQTGPDRCARTIEVVRA